MSATSGTIRLRVGRSEQTVSGVGREALADAIGKVAPESDEEQRLKLAESLIDRDHLDASERARGLGIEVTLWG